MFLQMMGWLVKELVMEGEVLELVRDAFADLGGYLPWYRVGLAEVRLTKDVWMRAWQIC